MGGHVATIIKYNYGDEKDLYTFGSAVLYGRSPGAGLPSDCDI